MNAVKVEALLRTFFFWPGMSADVQSWTSTCESCTQQKKGPEVKVPLVPILTSYPLEIVSNDLLSLGCQGDADPYLLVMTCT